MFKIAQAFQNNHHSHSHSQHNPLIKYCKTTVKFKLKCLDQRKVVLHVSAVSKLRFNSFLCVH